MSLCLLLFMYVLYSLCKIAFNYKKRDYLTTTLQVLFAFALLLRGCQIGSTLIVSDDNYHSNYVLVVVFCYLSEFCFNSAVIFQLFLWLDIGMMINFQRPSHFQNQDTQKLKFNKFERKLLLTLIVLEALVLTFLLANAILQIEDCNNTPQRTLDILIDSLMIVLEVGIGGFFVRMVRNHRSITWRTNYKETFSILIGMILSYVTKIATRTLYIVGVYDRLDDVVVYHIAAFIGFMISEFVPIALWTTFKTPEDYFQVYNDLPTQKFSIFQQRAQNKDKLSRMSSKSMEEDDEYRNNVDTRSRLSNRSENDELIYKGNEENYGF